MKTLGTMDDNRIVVGDLLKYTATYGLPLADVLVFLRTKNLAPCWIDLMGDMLAEGWNKRTALARIKEATTEVYDRGYSDVVVERLTTLFEEF